MGSVYVIDIPIGWSLYIRFIYNTSKFNFMTSWGIRGFCKLELIRYKNPVGTRHVKKWITKDNIRWG